MRALTPLLVLLGGAPALARVCSDPCLEAARGDYVTCRQDAGATFLGDVRYWFEWSPLGTQPWLEAGYRVVGFNHDFGGGNDLALQLRGPLMALGFAF